MKNVRDPMPKYIRVIEKLGACDTAMCWLKRRRFRTLSQAWKNCPFWAWLDWLNEKRYKERRLYRGSYARNYRVFSRRRWLNIDTEAQRQNCNPCNLSAASSEKIGVEAYLRSFPKPPKHARGVNVNRI